MPLTVGQVAALPDLGLIVRTTGAALDHEVRWVAVSEHADPTPWLEGGDLLLTTGMSLTDAATQARDYVARLLAADVAALGFGVGFSHQEIPDALVAAAEDAGLPVLEVPQPVPFVALSKAVSRQLAAEEYAESAASFESQRRLLRAVLARPDGVASQPGVVAVVARHVDGFVLHLGPSGEVLAAHPPAAASRAADLSAEVDRLRARGLLASSALGTADEHIVILPVGVRGTADGFLVVGSPRSLRSGDQAVMNLAVSLLSWEASRPGVLDEGMDPWRHLLITVAERQGLSSELLEPLGLSAVNPGSAVAVTVRAVRGNAVAESVLADANRTGLVLLARRPSGDLGGFARVDDGEVPSALVQLAAEPEVQAVGVSCPLDLTEAANVRQAIDQADRAAALGGGLRSFGEEPSRGLAALLDASTTAAWASGYLGDLMTTAEGPELRDTLLAWLDQHGQVDAAAQRLGIHRHTVRHRLRRAEGVLGRELDDPEVRADLWFALAAVRRTEPASETVTTRDRR